MSNIAKKLIIIPDDLKIKIVHYNNYKQLIISYNNFGLWNINYINIPKFFEISIENCSINLRINNQLSKGAYKSANAFFGTLYRLIHQMAQKSFKKILSLSGVGYKIEILDSEFIGPSGTSQSLPNSASWSTDRTEVRSYTCGSTQKILKFNLGVSHPVFIPVPGNIHCSLLNSNMVEFSSGSLQDLTQFLSKIVQIKPSKKDKYKSKGFRLL